MENQYSEYIIEQLRALLDIPSPSGFTRKIEAYLVGAVSALGFEPRLLNKGGVRFLLGGAGEPVLLMAHADTLGAQVKFIKDDGRIMITRVGGLNPNNVEAENVLVHTRSGDAYEGTIQLVNASVHVNADYNTVRVFDENIELVLDKLVDSAGAVRALGIKNGDFITLEPRFTMSGDGFIKARFLDDKIGVAILLAFAKYVKENNAPLRRKVYACFTMHEEVLHAGGAAVPEDAVELLGVDMGCVGKYLDGSETKVSIVAGDSYGPYNYDIITRLSALCEERGIDYAIDCYSRYTSDVDVALIAGHDARHGLIGPGVYASHGYERTNIKAVLGAFELLKAYLCE